MVSFLIESVCQYEQHFRLKQPFECLIDDVDTSFSTL